MKVAEYNSIAEAPGEMNKDAEDNSITEILGGNLFCDSILLFNVFNVSSWGGKYRVSIKPRVGRYNEWFPEMEKDLNATSLLIGSLASGLTGCSARAF